MATADTIAQAGIPAPAALVIGNAIDAVNTAATGAISATSLTLTQGAITTDLQTIGATATWNNAAVTFTGIKYNVTDTSSNAASLLMDLQVGGSSKFKVDKLGVVTLGSSLSLTAGNITVQNGYAIQVLGAGAQFWARNDAAFFAIGTTADVFLNRDAANTLALRNSTNAQTFRAYRSYTDASNYSRVSLSFSSTTALLATEGLGTGSRGNLAFGSAALATNATLGYVMIPTCAGIPTGVPADIPTGQVALHYDSTNNKLYVYNGAWKSTAALT